MTQLSIHEVRVSDPIFVPVIPVTVLTLIMVFITKAMAWTPPDRARI